MPPPITTSNIPSGWNTLSSFDIVLTPNPSIGITTFHTTDGQEPTDTSSIDRQFNISGQGIWEIKYFSREDAYPTNREATKTDYLKLDNVAPISYIISSFSPDGNDNWYITNPLISIFATDETSDVNKIFYRWDTASYGIYSTPIQIPSQGVHVLNYYAMDNAGNVESVKSATFKFDQVAPSTQADIPSGLQKHPATISFYSSDSASGVLNTYYTVDGTTPTTSSPSGSSITISASGTYVIKYFSIDYAGHQEAVKTGSVQLLIDTSAPETYVFESFPIDGNNGWYRQSPLISISASDESGIAAIKYKLFPFGEPTTAKYTSIIDLTDPVNLVSNYNVKIEIDQSGIPFQIDLRGFNPSLTTIDEIIIKINNATGIEIATQTGPDGLTGTGYVTLTSPTAGIGSPTSEIKFTAPSSNDATLEVFGLDENSYPHKFTESVVFKNYTTPLILSTNQSIPLIGVDGKWQLNYYAIDTEGNQGIEGTKLYQLDSTAPDTILSTDHSPEGLGGWYRVNPLITLTAQDIHSGVYNIYFQWDNGNITIYNSPINVPSAGQHTLRYYAIDRAGNIEIGHEELFKWDNVAPITTDNTLDCQGLIFTTKVYGYESVVDERISNASGYNVQVSKSNVKSVSRVFVEGKGFYHVETISGANKNVLTLKNLITNENSIKNGPWQITVSLSLPQIIAGLSDIFRIFNVTKNVYYTPINVVSNIINLSGEIPITDNNSTIEYLTNSAYGGESYFNLQHIPLISCNLYKNNILINVGTNPDEYSINLITGQIYLNTALNTSDTLRAEYVYADILQVDYCYQGGSLAYGDQVHVDYYYDLSNEEDVLNTDEYTIIERPYGDSDVMIHDHSLTITLFPTDNASGVWKTYYTTDGTTPTTSSSQGTSIFLDPSEDEGLVTYTIRYFSVDISGNAESVVTARYPVKIDKTLPKITLTTFSDPRDQGRVGWHQKDFSIVANITSKDVERNVDEVAHKVDFCSIFTDQNDWLDFNDGTDKSVQLKTIKVVTGNNDVLNIVEGGISRIITLNLGKYTPTNFAQEVQNQLGGSYTVNYSSITKKYTITSPTKFDTIFSTSTAKNLLGFTGNIDYIDQYSCTSEFAVKTFIFGYTKEDLCLDLADLLNSPASGAIDPNFTVSIINENLIGYHFEISNTSNFDLKWSSGSNNLKSIGKTLNFETSSDDTGLNTYTSDYFRVKIGDDLVTKHYFIKEVLEIKDSLTLEPLEFKYIVPGYSGFYDEVVIDGIIPPNPPPPDPPDDVRNILIDYRRFVGVDHFNLRKDSDINWDQFDVIGGGLDYLQSYSFIDGPTFQYGLSSTNPLVSEGEHTLYAVVYGANQHIPPKVSNVISTIYKLDSQAPITDNYTIEYLTIIGTEVDDFYLQNYPITFCNLYKNNILLTAGVGYTITFSNGHIHLNSSLINSDSLRAEYLFLNPNWQKAPINVVLRYFDPPSSLTPLVPGSGVVATHYTIDGTTPTESSPKIQDLPDEKIVLVTSGLITTKYFSVDEAGNIELVKTTNLIKLDADAPFTTLIINPPVPNGNNSWYVTAPQVSFSVVELHSGLASTWWKFSDETIWTEYTGIFTIPREGNLTLQYKSVDNVGNEEEVRSSIIKFDSVAPNTTTNIPVSGWTNDRFVRFTINDVASGGQTTYFTIDGSIPDENSPSGNQIEFQSSGIYTIKFFSKDYAGNVEAVKTETLRLDVVAPIISEFTPAGGIILPSTPEISFKVSDSFSGIDISKLKFFVDGIEYSVNKNSSYFHYTGTPAEYLVEIYPIQNELNFENIDLIQIKDVEDFAGNLALPFEISLIPQDITPPRIKQVYPIPNSTDVSTNSNVIFLIDDPDSGVDLRSVITKINNISFSLNVDDVLKIRYTGTETDVKLSINNKKLITYIDDAIDLNLDFVIDYKTLKQLADHLNTLTDYECEFVSQEVYDKYAQNSTEDIFTENLIDILSWKTLGLYIPEKNNFVSFIERASSFLFFVSPEFSFEHKVPVNISIDAKDNNGNIMPTFSWLFIPHNTATTSVSLRNKIFKCSLKYIDDIQQNIASNYTKSRSTEFYGHHKSIGQELCRLDYEMNNLKLDGSYTTIRDPYLYEKFGYLLQSPPIPGFSNERYHEYLLSLLQILFQGSTVKSIEQGIQLFTNEDVIVREAIDDPNSDIADEFTFTVDILIGDNLASLDVMLLNKNLLYLLNLIKPAHTFATIRFIYSDRFYIQAGCTVEWLKDQYGNYVLDSFGNKIPILDPSGFQVGTKNDRTAICARYRTEASFNYNDDTRIDCSEKQTEIISVTEDVSLQLHGSEDTFTTFYKPILKQTQLEIAQISDIQVTINGIPATITEFNPLEGIITLSVIPLDEDVILIHYHYNPNFVYRNITFYLNDYSVVLNDFDTSQGSIFNTDNVSDVIGGVVIDTRPHAHACEDPPRFEYNDTTSEQYEFPDCQTNPTEFFYLNSYEIDGNEFVATGSYLNDPNSIGRTSSCFYKFWSLNDIKYDQKDPPTEDGLGFIIDGSSYSETTDILTDDFTSFEVDYSDTYNPYPDGFVLNDTGSLLNNLGSLLNSGVGALELDDLREIISTGYNETINQPTEALTVIPGPFSDTYNIFKKSFVLNGPDLLNGPDVLLYSPDEYRIIISEADQYYIYGVFEQPIFS